MNGLHIRELPQEMAKVANTELNENPAKMREDVEYIRNWLQMQPHIIGRTDDQFLITFLRGCKYSYEKSKEKLDMYYTLRSAMPEIFNGRDPSDPQLEGAIKSGCGFPLYQPEDMTTPRINIFRLGAYDPHKLGLLDVMKVAYMIYDISLMENDYVCGYKIIIDLKGLTLAHIAEYTPSFVKKMALAVQDAYPLRQKGIHFVNPLPIFDAILKIFRSFLSTKLKNRIFVHDTYESLYEHVNKDILPTEYGGNGESVESIIATWEKKLISYRDYLIDDSKYKTDEGRRLQKSKRAEELFNQEFGATGSFRKLEFD